MTSAASATRPDVTCSELLPGATRLANRSYLMVPGSQVIFKLVNLINRY